MSALAESAPAGPRWPSVLTGPLSRLVAIFLVIVVALAVVADGFWSVDNALNIGRNCAVPGIAAIGIAIAMISGSIDVSVASTMSVAGVLAAEQIASGRGVGIALVVGLVAGAVLGLLNGLACRLLRLDAMIVTIGTMSVYSGWIFMRTNGVSVSAPNDTLAELGRGRLVGVPTPFVIFLIAAFVAAGLMRYTTYGQRCYLVGDNVKAASLMGIRVGLIRVSALVVCGTFAAVGGLLLTANAGIANPGSGARFLLPALAAVVVGGVSLAGGSGTITGVVIGVVLLATIDNGLNLLHVPSTWQDVIRGGVIVTGLIIDRLRRVHA